MRREVKRLCAAVYVQLCVDDGRHRAAEHVRDAGVCPLGSRERVQQLLDLRLIRRAAEDEGGGEVQPGDAVRLRLQAHQAARLAEGVRTRRGARAEVFVRRAEQLLAVEHGGIGPEQRIHRLIDAALERLGVRRHHPQDEIELIVDEHLPREAEHLADGDELPHRDRRVGERRLRELPVLRNFTERAAVVHLVDVRRLKVLRGADARPRLVGGRGVLHRAEDGAVRGV